MLRKYLLLLMFLILPTLAWWNYSYLYRIPITIKPNKVTFFNLSSSLVSDLSVDEFKDLTFVCGDDSTSGFSAPVYFTYGNLLAIADSRKCTSNKAYLYFGSGVESEKMQNKSVLVTFAYGGIGDNFNDGWFNISKWSGLGYGRCTIESGGYFVLRQYVGCANSDSYLVSLDTKPFNNTLIYVKYTKKTNGLIVTFGPVSVNLTKDNKIRVYYNDTLLEEHYAFVNDERVLIVFIKNSKLRVILSSPDNYYIYYDEIFNIEPDNANYPVKIGAFWVNSYYDIKIDEISVMDAFFSDTFGEIESYDPSEICSSKYVISVDIPHNYTDTGFVIRLNNTDKIIFYKDGLILPFVNIENETVVRIFNVEPHENNTIYMFDGCQVSSENKYAASYLFVENDLTPLQLAFFNLDSYLDNYYGRVWLYSSKNQFGSALILNVSYSDIVCTYYPVSNAFIGLESELSEKIGVNSIGSKVVIDVLSDYFEIATGALCPPWGLGEGFTMLVKTYPKRTEITFNNRYTNTSYYISRNSHFSGNKTTLKIAVLEVRYYPSEYKGTKTKFDWLYLYPYGKFNYSISEMQQISPTYTLSGGGGGFYYITGTPDLLINYSVQPINETTNKLNLNMTLVNTSSPDYAKVLVYYPIEKSKYVTLIPNIVKEVQFELPKSDKILVNITTDRLGIEKHLEIVIEQSGLFNSTLFSSTVILLALLYLLKFFI